METDRCPLCWMRADCGVLVHLRRDHRRSEAEALALLERNTAGTVGWNPDRRRATPPPLPAPATPPFPAKTRF